LQKKVFRLEKRRLRNLREI